MASVWRWLIEDRVPSGYPSSPCGVAGEGYRPATPEAVVLHIVRALGSLEDVADDPALL
jgi:hypothetical protein